MVCETTALIPTTEKIHCLDHDANLDKMKAQTAARLELTQTNIKAVLIIFDQSSSLALSTLKYSIRHGLNQLLLAIIQLSYSSLTYSELVF